MKKSEKILLESKTPEEYVENALKCRLKPSEKAKLTRLWRKKTGYTQEELIHARNRNEYWKKRKVQGAAARTKKRMQQHDYSLASAIEWTPERIEEFIRLNRKDAYGRYLYRDWELAMHFGTSIPSIQYMRRKYNKVRKMLGPGARHARILEYMGCSEMVLQRGGPQARQRSSAKQPQRSRSS